MRNLTNAIRKRRLTNGVINEPTAPVNGHEPRDRASSTSQQRSPTASCFTESPAIVPPPDNNSNNNNNKPDQQQQSYPDESWDAPSAGLFNSNNGDHGLLKRVSSMPGNLSIFRQHLTNPLHHPEFHAAPQYTRRQAAQMAAGELDDTPVYGMVLLAVTVVVFVVSVYALVVSKFMPYTGVVVLDAVKDDDYFCLLVPITGLSFNFAVFWNWLGMKYFRHN
ncbi:hypothetical protein H4R99_004920 [Coemansia sp. RSA 1722]|nr:hypothetical protein LPJ57_002695 [Coemansia sp. RSA 486]KAJ2596444.1 hypothetical protein H4R99_004920 [Coemansia sp. RSA 1722]